MLEMYGPDVKRQGSYAYNCLMARRLVERGVRYVQLFHAGIAEFPVKMQDDFRIRARVEHVAARLQIFPQLHVIEDLAVESEAESAVGSVHGLMAAFEIDNAEAAMGQARPAIGVDAGCIGPAMRECADAAPKPRFVRVGVVEIKVTRDSAHKHPVTVN